MAQRESLILSHLPSSCLNKCGRCFPQCHWVGCERAPSVWTPGAHVPSPSTQAFCSLPDEALAYKSSCHTYAATTLRPHDRKPIWKKQTTSSIATRQSQRASRVSRSPDVSWDCCWPRPSNDKFFDAKLFFSPLIFRCRQNNDRRQDGGPDRFTTSTDNWPPSHPTPNNNNNKQQQTTSSNNNKTTNKQTYTQKLKTENQQTKQKPTTTTKTTTTKTNNNNKNIKQNQSISKHCLCWCQTGRVLQWIEYWRTAWENFEHEKVYSLN